jgi:hypothetical protein
MNFVVTSVNGIARYNFYIPIIKWAWEKLGWQLLVLTPFELHPFRNETITQCIRLYASILKTIKPDDMVMTTDADMIPLSDYWQPDNTKLTIYGHDLTNFNHVPICYIAAPKYIWGEMMHLSTPNVKELMQRDLTGSKALSEIQSEWWQVDQDIVTERVKDFEKLFTDHVVKINRGVENTGYPLGRFDRSVMKYPESGKLIDFHCPVDGWNHIETIKDVLIKSFGEHPPWIDSYTSEFKASNSINK